MARAEKVKFDLDEVSDDVFDLVLNWRKEVRRKQALGKMPKKMTYVEWVQGFVDYVAKREEIRPKEDA